MESTKAAAEVENVVGAPLLKNLLQNLPLTGNIEARGLRFSRSFCPEAQSPWNTTSWETRQAQILDASGKAVFEQDNVEIPSGWSQTATNVVASKYFRGPLNTPARERSVRQLIARVVDTITHWGQEDGYFFDDESASAFRDDLTWLCLHQHLAFNSPVWFNVGVEQSPQCSACFINSVQDTMESILDLAKTEGMLFKYGSGTGTNLSSLRGCRERLKGGGSASGPVSFMRGFDAFAGVIKSGGKTRRAAKMVILDVEHPDILDFVRCKAEEEKKAWALIREGYDGGFNVPGGAYDSVFFQNSNNSVRVTDDFMRAVELDGTWKTRAVTNGEVLDSFPARDLMNEIASATWLCGDPGIQFDTTINDWNTCSISGRIRGSNPCSEYMFLDDSACNLASLNLMRFQDANGDFQVDLFKAAVRLSITAQDILVERASYPTPAIRKNSLAFRPLGLGYANLGALLMSRGLPYDSDNGRAYASAITALMHGEACLQSARLASRRGPFPEYEKNSRPMLRVISKHRRAAHDLPERLLPADLYESAQDVWDKCLSEGRVHGYRNAQLTVLAPTGTIGFLMDCDTTGVEPDIALVKYKKLVGGGVMKIANRTVPQALQNLGYNAADQATIQHWLEEYDTIEGAPCLRNEHLPVFDCAFKPTRGERAIAPLGHLRMMGAVQPFLSGAISKTVNVPEDYSPEDIADLYLQSWRMGLKALAVYRDGCKRSQPLTTSQDRAVEKGVVTEIRPKRRKLPDERRALTHKFNIAGHEGYITAGMYDDNTVGEIFLVMAKEGSVVSGLMDGFATSVSMALQYGVPLPVLCDKFRHTRFEPSGFTGNPAIPIAKSILDYIFSWLELKFLNTETETPAASVSSEPAPVEPAAAPSTSSTRESFVSQADAPPCQSCGSIMVRSGSCYRCLNCGGTSGCS